MAFITRTCGVGERLLMGVSLHWIALAPGVLVAFVLLAAGGGMKRAALRHYVQSGGQGFSPRWYEIADAASLACAAIGFIVFAIYAARYLTTRIGLTNRRVIIKTGLLFVRVDETDLEELKSERVRHGLLGRFLDYGEVYFDARFVRDFYIPAIKDPYRFLRAVHGARGVAGDTLVNPARVQPAPAPVPANESARRERAA